MSGDERTCREDGCEASLAGTDPRRQICDDHQAWRKVRRCRACREPLAADARMYCADESCQAQAVRARRKRERAGQERFCKECGGSLAGTPGAQKTCDTCKQKAPPRKRKPQVEGELDAPRPPSLPIPAHEGFDSLGFVADVRERDRQRMAEARERLRAA